MKGYFWFLMVFIALCGGLQAQETAHTFRLQGVINADSGRMILMPAAQGDFYQYARPLEVVLKRGGSFEFKDSIQYPSAYRIGLKCDNQWVYLSNTFFIEPGDQKIWCNRDSSRVVPRIDNNTTRELENDYLPLFDKTTREYEKTSIALDSLEKQHGAERDQREINALTERLNRIEQREDMILYRYTFKHRNSYVALWKIIELLPGGFKGIYDSSYAVLNHEVKYCYAGQRLKKKLEQTERILPGRKFPMLQLYNTDQMKAYAPEPKPGIRYTLVEFWFSNCYPCLRQFPAWKNLYANWHDKGLEIVGISVDTKEYVQNWKNVIAEHQLPWPQYLDIDKRNADMYCIDYCPTNFLLDENGVILQKNIKPAALEELLKSGK